jgi:hypothetical protein
VIVIDADAVHDHSTVVVILDAASIALGAVVHSGQLKDLAVIAEIEVSVVLHLVVDHFIWFKSVVEQETIKCIFEQRLTIQIDCWRIDVIGA